MCVYVCVCVCVHVSCECDCKTVCVEGGHILHKRQV